MKITEGFKEAAEKFQQESGIDPSINLNTMDDRIKIRDEIQSGRIEEAILLVNKLYPDLLDNDRHLYFHLQVIRLYHHKILIFLEFLKYSLIYIIFFSNYN